MKKIKEKRGQALIELLLAIGLASVLIPALMTGFSAIRSGRVSENQRLIAINYLREGEEAVRIVQSNGWNNISVGTYHPVISATTWVLAAGSEVLNGTYTRQVVIADVYRDTNGNIISSGGTLDPSTKKVTITVSWPGSSNSSVSSTTYLTRYTNISNIWQTVPDFTGTTGNTSALLNTAIISNGSDGAVTLNNVSYADWCNPQQFVINQINLPKLSNAIYAREGGAYLGSGDGTSGSPGFINVSVSTPAPPATPSAYVAGTYNGAFTTNSIYSDGRYVYLAVTTSPQVLILDLSTNPYTQIGTVTVPGGLPATSVYLYGNILFVTSGNYLYTFDVTTKTGSHTTAKSSIRMYAGIWTLPSAQKVIVANNVAFVGTGGSLLGMQSFSFNSDGSNLKLKAVALLTFSQDTQGMAIDSTNHYLYMVFNNASGISFTRGLIAIDITRLSWFLIYYYPTYYTYNTGGMDPRGVAVAPTADANQDRAIVVGVGGGSAPGTEQYQVANTSTLYNGSSNPGMSYCGGYPISNGVYGISSILDSYSNAYSYIITGEANNQFKIIRGGLGGSGYSLSGTYTSGFFDSGTSSTFNSFVAAFQKSQLTDVQFQVSVNGNATSNCSALNYDFVGLNGTSSGYFATGSAIPVGNLSPNYSNPGRCFKFKANLSTTTASQTPVLNKFIVNYSP